MATLKLAHGKLSGKKDVTVVTPHGELVAETCPQFDAFLRQVENGRAKRLIVDLSHVVFMNSAAIGVLIEARERCIHARGWLGLIAANEVVRSTIDMLGLAEYFHLSADTEDLLRKLSKPSSPRARRARRKR